jgi:hypothetical protein
MKISLVLRICLIVIAIWGACAELAVAQSVKFEIERGVRDFHRDYKRTGIHGLTATVGQCWEAFREKNSLNAAAYCFSMDYATSIMDENAAKYFRMRQNDATKIEMVLIRVNEALLDLNFDQAKRGEVISEWTISTERAFNSKIDR